MRHVLILLFVLSSAAHAGEPTRVTVRVLAHDAKLIGDVAGGVAVVEHAERLVPAQDPGGVLHQRSHQVAPVGEVPTPIGVEEVLGRLIGNSEFIKGQRDVAAPKVEPAVKGATAKSLNDTLTARELTVGLNDRLAFVKHLFDEQADVFGKVVGDLNGMESLEQSVAYIEKQVKPKYNWEGKEAYQQRFMELIERRFS